MSSDPTDRDRYERWYQHKLWNLLPALYRAEDWAELGRKGPLEEVVERIGTQVAIVRRSIDRLWEDQSIETCDDWVIDYLGDLLATNLVASLDAPGRRLDVARTIYYRRRKGTLGVAEELAGDITRWHVRVAEMFVRLGRTRHLLDPAIGIPADPATSAGQLQRDQRLVGRLTRTGAGGYADLRDRLGASLARTAFDELAYTADVRRGRGATGWHGIPRLGVFVWRLHRFAIVQGTPVQDRDCLNQYTFDPTGRDTPLFASGVELTRDRWTARQAHELPGPISPELLAGAARYLYPGSVQLYRWSGVDYLPVASAELWPPPPAAPTLWIDPVRGRILAPVTADDGPFRVDYHLGFSSEIGAGTYPRRRDPTAAATHVGGGGASLEQQLAGVVNGTATVVVDDSLTYPRFAPVAAIHAMTVVAADGERPVVRPAPDDPVAAWTFTGADADAELTIDGLLVSGVDVVLAGVFRRVTIRCTTLDPGTWLRGAAPGWGEAADGRVLAPARLRIAGQIRELVVDRSITGPIASEGAGGWVERVVITDSIVQAAQPDTGALALSRSEVELDRCTLLGRARVHRLDASECILHDRVVVDDYQHGCVRFSAFATGGVLPRQYECVPIEPRAPLFASLDYGRPELAQLRATVGSDIREGAEDGSEMGAFARERAAIKERSLLIKYQEYLPLGIEPVVVHVT